MVSKGFIIFLYHLKALSTNLITSYNGVVEARGLAHLANHLAKIARCFKTQYVVLRFQDSGKFNIILIS